MPVLLSLLYVRYHNERYDALARDDNFCSSNVGATLGLLGLGSLLALMWHAVEMEEKLKGMCQGFVKRTY